MTAAVTPLAALVMLVIVTVACLWPRLRTRLHWSLASGLAALAVEAGIAYVLLAVTERHEDRLFWLQAHQAIGVVALMPWVLFVMALLNVRPTVTRRGWRVSVAIAGAAAVVLGVAAFQSSG